MLPYRDSRITQAVLLLFFVLLVGYGYFEAQGLLFGPSITVTSSITSVHQAFITISGHADRISSLEMNGNPVEVTETGDFSIPYLLAPGYNRIVLDARDKYGRDRTRTLEIVYTDDSATSASSTPVTLPTMTGTSSSTISTSTPVAPGQ